MQNAEIRGVEYQQGELAGYEIREYLLEKWKRRCAYCQRTGISLQVEHIVPRARGGTNRVANLTLSCEPCNKQKGTQTAVEFGHPEIQVQAQQPLRDAAAVNSTRWELYRRLPGITELPIEIGTGGRTKWNRTSRGLPKTHWLDAVCVGASTPLVVDVRHVVPLHIMAMGRQKRQMCLVDENGFPRTKAKQMSSMHSFRTGDLVRAIVPLPRKTAGGHVGRASVKARKLTLATRHGSVANISYRFCTLLQRSDGYKYVKGETALPSLA
jgi:hypothetical protein